MLLSGIRKTTVGDSIIVVIEELTDDIKREIRQRLVEICYGKANANSTLKAYSYSATVKEFIRRYKESSDKNNTRNKGMIGELLFHVVFGMEGDYVPISAFLTWRKEALRRDLIRDITHQKAINCGSLRLSLVKCKNHRQVLLLQWLDC